MVLLKEYRICMPLSVEEYQIGQLYMVARHSLEQTANGEGVEVVENKECNDPEHGKGMYTEKRIYVSSRLPYWIQAMIPKIFYVTEKAWNYYPYTITEYTCSFLPRLQILIKTAYENNNGCTDNCLKLSLEQLAERHVEHMDIAYDEISPKHYKEEEDPRFFQSQKTHRGPLVEDWRNSTHPIMCSYKVVEASFEVWGLQTRVEDFIQSCIKEILLVGHRQAFAWIDEWIEMNYEDVKKYEANLQSGANTLVKPTQQLSEDGSGENRTTSISYFDTNSSGSANSLAVTPESQPSPKSPAKKGYFSWF